MVLRLQFAFTCPARVAAHLLASSIANHEARGCTNRHLLITRSLITFAHQYVPPPPPFLPIQPPLPSWEPFADVIAKRSQRVRRLETHSKPLMTRASLALPSSILSTSMFGKLDVCCQ